MADRVLPSREKWNIPHSPETAWDIAGEMSGKERRLLAARWLEGRLVDREAIPYEDCQDPWECCIHVPRVEV